MASRPDSDRAGTERPDAMNVLGVDGARGGWIGVRWDGTTAEPLFEASLADLIQTAGPVAAIAVDIPIGLADDGQRRCDISARPMLGPRRSSLFTPPATGALDLPDYATANAWSKAHTGQGLSKQAWMLVPKIREARDLAARVELHETFPELTFRAMHGGTPLTHAKRTWTGLRTRLELLTEHGITIGADVGPAGSVAADDMIDAGALSWSAMRIARGEAEHLPADLHPGEPSIWW